MIYYPISVLMLAGIPDPDIIGEKPQHPKSNYAVVGLCENAQPMLKNDYGKYLLSILEEKEQTLKKNLEY